jgi:hypothetical protein
VNAEKVNVTVLLCVLAEGTALVIAERSVLRKNLDHDRTALKVF